MDARDPHFMQKLNQLGPVKVDHNMSVIKTVRGSFSILARDERWLMNLGSAR